MGSNFAEISSVKGGGDFSRAYTVQLIASIYTCLYNQLPVSLRELRSRELHGDGDHGFPAVTTVTPRQWGQSSR